MEFVNPEKVIDTIDIRPGFSVADFGAGSGFYSIAAARKLGNSGTVFAIDIRKEALEAIRSRAKLEHLHNIETVWTDLEIPGSLNLKDESCDVVIISNILFQVDNKKAVIQEAQRVLKASGEVIVVEWRKQKASDGGPPENSRISKQQTLKEFELAGFKSDREFDAGKHHYGLVLTK